MRFFEVAKVFSLTAHNIIPKPVLINPAFYNKLPDDIKKVLKEVIRECTIFQRGLYANNFTADIEWLKKQGVVVVSDVDKASFQKKLLPVWAKFSDVIGDELMEETKRALGMK